MTEAEFTDFILKVLGLIGAIAAFLTGLWQYWKAQKWKRSEWLTQEAAKCFGNPSVSRALRIIDWDGRRIAFPNEAAPNEVLVVTATDDFVATALEPHDNREGFTDKEAAIRDAFDQLLDEFERLAGYAAAGLVSEDDLKPYLGYWLDRIRLGAQGTESKRFRAIIRYIKRYKFREVELLLQENDTLPTQVEVGGEASAR